MHVKADHVQLCIGIVEHETKDTIFLRVQDRANWYGLGQPRLVEALQLPQICHHELCIFQPLPGCEGQCPHRYRTIAGVAELDPPSLMRANLIESPPPSTQLIVRHSWRSPLMAKLILRWHSTGSGM